jgi:glycine betaine catabolism B
MPKFIDNLLNKVAMYRLVLYYLIGLWVVALILSTFGILPYEPLGLILSAAVIVAISWAANTLFAGAFKVKTNTDSLFITAMILVLVLTPPKLSDPRAFIALAGWAAIWSMASKFMFAWRQKHLFNPAAFAMALVAFTLNQSATWWVGNLPLLPFVLVGGILVARKIRRFDLVLSFLGAALVSIVGFALLRGANPWGVTIDSIFHSSLLFFAFVMITEPLTTPPTRPLRMAYGALVGLLFAPQMHIGSIYSTPELALLVGNLFSYWVSPKGKLSLALKKKVEVAKDTYDFIFESAKKWTYQPGQYLEWTLDHDNPDNRGNRRYFTISSSPTEPELAMGVKFYPNPSTYKKALLDLKKGKEVVAAQLSGDFVLPKDKGQKLVFIAGGIGVTPFRSMVKYLIDLKEKRDVVMFYSVRTPEDVAYQDIFDQAERGLGMRMVYVAGEAPKVSSWKGKIGRLDEAMIRDEVPDFAERAFYISGPNAMVMAFWETLVKMGVPRNQIKTDFFPGFA